MRGKLKKCLSAQSRNKGKSDLIGDFSAKIKYIIEKTGIMS